MSNTTIELKDALDIEENKSDDFKSKFIPVGGNQGQGIIKQTVVNFDVAWGDIAPANAQKNSDITSEEIGAKIRLLSNGVVAIQAYDDWNNYTDTGFYMGTTLANRPSGITGANDWWYVIVIKHNSTWCVQIAVDFNNVATVIRTLTNNSWSSWRNEKYTHPSGLSNQPGTALVNAAVISQITVNTEGHVTGVSQRNLTAANVGAASASHTHVEADLSLSDNTTNNSSTSRHGFLPKLNGSTSNYLRGDGSWVTPPDNNTTYSEISTTEIDAGTASTLKTITGRRAKYIIDKSATANHGHGNITNAGAVGTAANIPLITGTSGVIQAGSFGTAANTFCQGNDSRLADDKTRKITISSDEPTGGSDGDIWMQYE